MLKLSASFSKKVPGESRFSSQSYHAGIETELPDGLGESELRQRLQRTFALVRDSVEAEIQGPQQAQEPPEIETVQPQSAGEPPREPPASVRQLQYLVDLGARQGLDRQQLEAHAHQRYGAGLAQLSRPEASALIHSLQAQAA